MRAPTVQTGIARHLSVRRRREHVCLSSLVFLMGVTRKHALEEAARFCGLHTSPCSKMVKAQSDVAVSTLESLAKKHAQHVATARHKVPALPWDMAIVVESPLPHRARLPPENAQTCQHGHGFVVGHPWTTSGLSLHDRLRPLRPIPFSRQR